MIGTKEKILNAALHLFAESGYEAVSTAAIAGKLGISKAALYKHYKNKRDIWDSILARMEQEDRSRAESAAMPGGTPEETPEAYGTVTRETLAAYSVQQFDYWTAEAFPSAFRRMLTLEQYRSPEMAALYQQYLAAGPVGYLTDLFRETDRVSRERAEEMAAASYAPMFLYYSLYDGAKEKEAVRRAAHRQIEAVVRRLPTD